MILALLFYPSHNETMAEPCLLHPAPPLHRAGNTGYRVSDKTLPTASHPFGYGYACFNFGSLL